MTTYLIEVSSMITVEAPTQTKAVATAARATNAPRGLSRRLLGLIAPTGGTINSHTRRFTCRSLKRWDDGSECVLMTLDKTCEHSATQPCACYAISVGRHFTRRTDSPLFNEKERVV